MPVPSARIERSGLRAVLLGRCQRSLVLTIARMGAPIQAQPAEQEHTRSDRESRPTSGPAGDAPVMLEFAYDHCSR